MTTIHKNSQKRYYQENETYFVTTKTGNNYPFFKELIFCELLIENLKLCKELKNFKLLAFCLNYDHAHLLIQPSKEFNISKIMFSIKKQFSHDVNRIMDYNKLFTEGGQTFARLQKDKIILIIKHQNKIKEYKKLFLEKYENKQPFPTFFWQPSFHDHVIRDERDLQNHYNYTIYNFLKHKLPDNWQYTSINYTDAINVI